MHYKPSKIVVTGNIFVILIAFVTLIGFGIVGACKTDNPHNKNDTKQNKVRVIEITCWDSGHMIYHGNGYDVWSYSDYTKFNDLDNHLERTIHGKCSTYETPTFVLRPPD